MNQKLSTLEAIILFISITFNMIILNYPKLLINATETGAIFNCLFLGIIAFIFLLIVLNLFKKFPTCDILDISKYLGGKKLEKLVGIYFIILLLLGLCLSLSHFSVLLKIVYFETTPIIFILILLIIASLICNLNGFSAVKNSILFYFPIVFITLSILLKNNINLYTPMKIVPLFGKSFSQTFFYDFFNISIFSNILLIFFLLPKLENNRNFKKIAIISFLISLIFYILTITAILSNFPINSQNNELNSVYMLTRKLELSTFLQRVDGIFVYIGIFSFLSFISFITYLITNIIKKLFILKDNTIIAYPISSLALGISYIMIITNFFEFEGISIFKYCFFILIYVISFFILLFSNIKKKSN